MDQKCETKCIVEVWYFSMYVKQIKSGGCSTRSKLVLHKLRRNFMVVKYAFFVKPTVLESFFFSTWEISRVAKVVGNGFLYRFLCEKNPVGDTEC